MSKVGFRPDFLFLQIVQEPAVTKRANLQRVRDVPTRPCVPPVLPKLQILVPFQLLITTSQLVSRLFQIFTYLCVEL